MTLLLVSFIAGVLTILAPCILPILPIVVGRSVDSRDKYKPIIISLSLGISVIVFTLLLKASTVFIDIPQKFWSALSASIIIFFGLTALFPGLWETITAKFNFATKSNIALGTAAKKKGPVGDIMVGAALGPVFSSCSPTYFLILAAVLPESFAKGLVYLIAYSIGLSGMLILIGYLGQKVTGRLTNLADPRGWFKRALGILFILVGLSIATGYDKVLEAKLLDTNFFGGLVNLEQNLLTEPMEDKMDTNVNARETMDVSKKAALYPKYVELVAPNGYVNTDKITISELVGDKVVLLDIWTFSCINCQRTFPYLREWYRKYHDLGLEIIGVHTPEFAFEKKLENVEQAAKDFGLTYPIVLDNNYQTWNAYGNRYWPRKYLIDIDGYIVYDHIGEGGYEETEMKIQQLLQERSDRLNLGLNIYGMETADITEYQSAAQSPETYFGAKRNRLGNGQSGLVGEQVFVLPNSLTVNQAYLGGTWTVSEEYMESVSPLASINYLYRAKNVYLVAEADKPTVVQILRDGQPIAEIDGQKLDNGYITISESKLYHLILEEDYQNTHRLQIIAPEPGVRFYTFTFG